MVPPVRATPFFSAVLLACCGILIISFGIRASFGLFQIPIAEQFGWPRADFSLAIAVQNLAWGVGQPIFGAIDSIYGWACFGLCWLCGPCCWVFGRVR